MYVSSCIDLYSNTAYWFISYKSLCPLYSSHSFIVVPSNPNRVVATVDMLHCIRHTTMPECMYMYGQMYRKCVICVRGELGWGYHSKGAEVGVGITTGF